MTKRDFHTSILLTTALLGVILCCLSLLFHRLHGSMLIPITLWFLGNIRLLQIFMNARFHPRKCDQCGFKMTRLSEGERYLNQQQKMEEKIKSCEYDLWVCTCGERQLFVYPGLQAAHYENCTVCHVRGVYSLRQIVSPEGVIYNEGQCIACHSQYKASEKKSYVPDPSLPTMQFK